MAALWRLPCAGCLNRMMLPALRTPVQLRLAAASYLTTATWPSGAAGGFGLPVAGSRLVGRALARPNGLWLTVGLLPALASPHSGV